MVEGTPPGDALPPPLQRATPARRGARCGAAAGSPGPHRPHPGHTGRGAPAARSRGWAAGVGTAPDTRRPSQRWQATPPGDGPPPPPRHAAPTGHAGQGDSAGPPHPHTRAHSTWVADPNSPPSWRAVGGVKVLPWVVVGAGGLGAGKTSGAGTRGVSLDVVIGVGTGYTNTNGGESSDNRSKVHADCGPAENPSL